MHLGVPVIARCIVWLADRGRRPGCLDLDRWCWQCDCRAASRVRRRGSAGRGCARLRWPRQGRIPQPGALQDCNPLQIGGAQVGSLLEQPRFCLRFSCFAGALALATAFCAAFISARARAMFVSMSIRSRGPRRPAARRGAGAHAPPLLPHALPGAASSGICSLGSTLPASCAAMLRLRALQRITLL